LFDAPASAKLNAMSDAARSIAQPHAAANIVALLESIEARA